MLYLHNQVYIATLYFFYSVQVQDRRGTYRVR